MKFLKKYFAFVVLLLLLAIPLIDLTRPGLPITHDGQDHVARIANFFINLQYANYIPRWAPNLNWGYGHPILEFLYPLPSYIASFFHTFGFSFIDSAKIVFALGMFFSGVTMYLWISHLFGKKAGFVASMLYVFAPYRFVELYVRGDIGENLAFVFVPLVFLYIDRLSQKNKALDVAFGACALSLLILSHNAMVLMFLPIIFAYGAYTYFLRVKEKRKFLISFIILIALGFGISAFFWVPAFFEGKFTLRNIVTAGVYKTRFVSIRQLLYGPWSYLGTGQFTVQLGILQWVMLIASAIMLPFLWIKKDKKRTVIAIMVAFSIVSIFAMLKESDFFWSRIILLQNFQFPWRFLAITVFTTAVLGSAVLLIIPKKFQSVTVVIIVLLLLILHQGDWHANGFLQKQDSFFTSIYNGTTDTGESSPIWSVRFMEKKPKAYVEIISGNANIKVGLRTPTKHMYTVQAKTAVQLVENTLYFPGWVVFVDGNRVPIEFQNPVHRGLMTFFVPKGFHQVLLTFSETKLRLFSDIISVCAIIALCSMLFFWRKFR